MKDIDLIIEVSIIRDCPNDINEAVSGLIFASARCGDVPELCAIRKLLEKRYGHKFAKTAVELFPGNLVNHQVSPTKTTSKFGAIPFFLMYVYMFQNDS